MSVEMDKGGHFKSATKKEYLSSEDQQQKQQSNQSEQALVFAIYNTIANVVFFACICLCAMTCYVLQSFIRPIFWALLTSAFLFSFKKYLTDKTRMHLNEIEKRGELLALETFLIPFKLIDFCVDFLWLFFRTKFFYILGLIMAIFLFHLVSSFYDYIVFYFFILVDSFNKLLIIIAFYSDNSWQFTFALVVGYLLALVFYWRKENTMLFQILSLPIWFSLSFHASSLMGSYRSLVLFLLFIMAFLGMFSLLNEYIVNYKHKLIDEANHEEELNSLKKTIDLEEESKSSMFDEQEKVLESSSDNEAIQFIDLTIFDHNESTIKNPKITNLIQKKKLIFLKYFKEKFYFESLVNIVSKFLFPVYIGVFIIKFNASNLFQWMVSSYKKRSLLPFDYSKTKNGTIESSKHKTENSDKYFLVLFWLLITVKLRYDMYILIPFLVIVWKLIKHLISSTYRFFSECDKILLNINIILNWIKERSVVLMPQPVVLVLKLFIKGDHKINNLLQKSMDSIVSALMIILIFLIALVGLVLLGIQVHSEFLQSISIASNILNENIYTNPELRNWLPEKDRLDSLYMAAIKNGHSYGREWISSRLRPMFASNLDAAVINSSNSSKFLMIEIQILEQWDNLYAYLSKKAFSNHNLEPGLVGNNNSNLSTKLSTSIPPLSIIKSQEASSTKPNLKRALSFLNAESFDYKYLALLLRDNFSILISIVDSLYLILKGNINLLSTILYTTVHAVFSSGFAVMNFFFSFVVYMTALFYLLSISSSLYKPLQWLTELIVLNSDFTIYSISKGHLLSIAIEESIRSVFVASFKMLLFYGVYTYTVHILFGVTVVYIPSILAGFLGFLPLIGTYWTSVPGVLELWLIRNCPIHAILFFLILILPSYFVDSAVYSEIKGGHPYLTGLSFAGGVYCFGLEGAILGPTVLCLLIVIGKMITNLTTKPVKSKTRTSTLTKEFKLLKSPSIET